MIFFLIVATALLSLIHYMNMGAAVVLLVNMPLGVYVWLLGFLLFVRFLQTINKLVPVYRRLATRFDRYIGRLDREESATVDKQFPKDLSKGKGQKRLFHTSSLARTPVRSQAGRDGRSKKSLYHSTLLRLHFDVDKISELFSVKGGRPLLNIIKSIYLIAGTRITPGSFRYIVSFVVTCSKIHKSQGTKGLTKFLKASGVSLQQALGGHRVHNMTLLGVRVSRTSSGIPRWIPAQQRMRIRSLDYNLIRATLSVINIYRVFKIPGQYKLTTITNPFKGIVNEMKRLTKFIPLFVRLFIPKGFITTKKMETFSKSAVRPMFKGGPGVIGILGEWNTHPVVLWRSLLALQRAHDMWEAFELLLNKFNYGSIRMALNVTSAVRTLKLNGNTILKPFAYIGKLGVKEEAAGKVRVFAMVDAWTQWILWPYHSMIFAVLKLHGMDGTFDQTKPLSAVKAVKGLWSLDLSAATDRLPIYIQRELMGAIFGFEVAGAWSHLLTGRAYRLHAEWLDKPLDLKYAVGQPMGALSSWASLALTHHFVVQVAAWRAGFPKWKLYTNYAVLGDDIVIGDVRVVKQYLAVLDILGVECGLHKSLLSHKGTALEFAKRTIVNGVDVSPVAFKEFYAASRNLGAFIEFVNKYKVPFARALQAFGVGWKVRSWLNKPIGKLSARIRLIILALNVPHSPETVNQFFNLGKAPVSQYAVDSIEVAKIFVKKETKSIIARLMENVNVVAKLSADEWSKDLSRTLLANMYGMDVQSFLSTAKLRPEYRALLDIRKQYSFVLHTLINMIWFNAQSAYVEEGGNLMKSLWNLSTTDFASAYMEFLDVSHREAAMSLHTFSTIRPNPQAVKGLITPQQVRFWKRWSSILQGTRPLPKEEGPVS